MLVIITSCRTVSRLSLKELFVYEMNLRLINFSCLHCFVFLVKLARAALFVGGLIVGIVVAPKYALLATIGLGLASVTLDVVDKPSSGSEKLDSLGIVGKGAEATTDAVFSHKLSSFGQGMTYTST